ncbi:hypothetical protein DDZ13_01060 [Coraliomargarita sinensis]|uniref:Uncharacterized protein n=1 Tax=Coraliomargarita sinensis TaxID=2174842 RepID=A0A317ZNR0_9BACT|nr:rhomboid family intramembrane serine protease [Coraliomargarita sinensis]PXA05489.1 hypothetical protein DDZ13_01060 [Coraliomargarita sinensis]
MLYDRPYMRQAPGNEPESAKASMVTTLLVITVGVFVLQQILNVFFPGLGGRGKSLLSEWFALSGENFRQLKVWTVLSYGFLHSTQTLFHILGNMLGLFFIGRILEPILGRQQFLLLYLGSTLIGGLTYLAFHIGGYQPVVGASAAVFGILTVFCFLRPEQPITLLLFFILPITVKPKWLFRVSLAVSIACLLFYELPGAEGAMVAHSAHLGGMLSGILYYRVIYLRGGSPFSRPSAAKPSVELPEWFKRRKGQPTVRKINYTVNRSSSRDELQKEVDRILDKINATGFGSLSDSEKQTLDHAKDILR